MNVVAHDVAIIEAGILRPFVQRERAQRLLARDCRPKNPIDEIVRKLRAAGRRVRNGGWPATCVAEARWDFCRTKGHAFPHDGGGGSRRILSACWPTDLSALWLPMTADKDNSGHGHDYVTREGGHGTDQC